MQEYSYEGSALSMKESGIILGGDLSGWKARLLLVLALGETNENERLQEILKKCKFSVDTCCFDVYND